MPIRGKYMIINAVTGRALDGGAPSGHVYGHPTPTPGNGFHEWNIMPATDAGQIDWYWVRSAAANHEWFLDGGGGDPPYINPQHLYGNTMQGWAIHDAEPGFVRITLQADGRAITGHVGTPVTLEPENPDNRFQLWRLAAV